MDGRAVMGRVVQVMVAAERGGNHVQAEGGAVENGRKIPKSQEARNRGGLYLKVRLTG